MTPTRPYTVAVVPAKVSSVRLPRKNVADLGGQPLFHFSVRVAHNVKDIDATVVSSEDDAVLEQARRLGAYPLKRPVELAAPDVTNRDVVAHALAAFKEAGGRRPELVVLLQPTHPFRRPEDIDAALAAMRNDAEADCLLTVVPAPERRGRIFGRRFEPEVQKDDRLFRVTGSFYILRPERTVDRGKLLGETILPFVLERPELEIDIDRASDLALARCMVEAHRAELAAFGLFAARE